MKNFNQFLGVIFGLSLLACATREPNPSLNLMSESQYLSVVDENMQTTQQYDGFHNILQFSAVLMNSNMQRAHRDQKARVYLWDEQIYNDESAKMEADLKVNTMVFISFFTPEAKNDNLAKSDTQWKLFLDVGGRRFEGKAKKVKLLTNEIRSFFPEHNRWSTAYWISFPVSTEFIDQNPGAKLTVTGPVTSKSVSFK